MTSSFNISSFTGSDGLKELEVSWNGLLSKSHNAAFYNQWDWHYSVSKHLLSKEITYYVFHQDGDCIAIIPLQLNKVKSGWKNWKSLTLPQHKHLVRSDVLIKTNVNLSELIEAFIRYLQNSKAIEWDLIQLSPFSQHSNLYKFLYSTPFEIQPIANSFFVQSNGDTPVNFLLSGKQLKNVRRLSKKAESDLGELSFQHTSDINEIHHAFDTFLELEASGWKGNSSENTSIAGSSELKLFYKQIITAFSQTKNVAINLLKASDTPIAGQFCIRTENTWYILKIAYDETYQAYSPGSIIMKMFIEQTADRAKQNDWEVNLTTSPDWAARWHFTTETLYKTEIFNTNLSGKVLSTLKKGKKYLDKK